MVEEDTRGPGWHLPTRLRGLVSPPTFLALTPSLGSGPQALAWASSRNRPSGNFTHSADTDQPDSQEPKDPRDTQENNKNSVEISLTPPKDSYTLDRYRELN